MTQIERWRDYLQRHPAVHAEDVDELEAHLRDQIDDLTAVGLSDDEAFLIAVGRVGRIDEVSQEYAREHSERLWKQLVLGPVQPKGRPTLAVALAMAVGAAVSVRLPDLLGAHAEFYAVNASLLVLPWLAGYFLWQRAASRRLIAATLGAFVVLAAVANLVPLPTDPLVILVAIHLPVVAWFVMGLAYVAGQWDDHDRRMDFVRFTGEWVVYLALLALGGGVLLSLALAGASAIDLVFEDWLWLVSCGAAGAVIVAAWLVETKQAMVENIAPVLTAVFTPVTTILLTVYLIALLANLSDVDRDLLIVADLILVLVVGLVLYAVSARDPGRPPGWFDRLQLALIGLALAVDLVMLFAMSGRIVEFGITANKAAALGLNIVLLGNLVGAAWIGWGFLRRQRGFGAVERWQTGYLPVFAVWAAVVALGLPLVFGWQP